MNKFFKTLNYGFFLLSILFIESNNLNAQFDLRSTLDNLHGDVL